MGGLGCSTEKEALWQAGSVSGRYEIALAACDKRQLHEKHIRHLTVDSEGNNVATMTVLTCPRYTLAGSSIRDGLVVEFGTWAGSSMRCMGGGLNQTGKHN